MILFIIDSPVENTTKGSINNPSETIQQKRYILAVIIMPIINITTTINPLEDNLLFA